MPSSPSQLLFWIYPTSFLVWSSLLPLQSFILYPLLIHCSMRLTGVQCPSQRFLGSISDLKDTVSVGTDCGNDMLSAFSGSYFSHYTLSPMAESPKHTCHSSSCSRNEMRDSWSRWWSGSAESPGPESGSFTHNLYAQRCSVTWRKDTLCVYKRVCTHAHTHTCVHFYMSKSMCHVSDPLFSMPPFWTDQLPASFSFMLSIPWNISLNSTPCFSRKMDKKKHCFHSVLNLTNWSAIST